MRVCAMNRAGWDELPVKQMLSFTGSVGDPWGGGGEEGVPADLEGAA